MEVDNNDIWWTEGLELGAYLDEQSKNAEENHARMEGERMIQGAFKKLYGNVPGGGPVSEKTKKKLESLGIKIVYYGPRQQEPDHPAWVPAGARLILLYKNNGSNNLVNPKCI